MEDVFEQELFAAIRVRELQDEDFLLQSGEKIVLNAKGCSVILFYVIQNETSRGLRAIWNTLSERFAGVNFFAVNASRRYNIMKAFSEVNNEIDHPLHEYGLPGFPSILVYREAVQPGLSWPKAFYNGEFSTAALQDWILMLACQPGYKEFPSIRSGVISDENITVYDGRISEDNGNLRSTDFQSEDFDFDRVAVDAALDDLQYDQEFIDDDFEVINDNRPQSYDTFSKYPRGKDPGYLAGLKSYNLDLDN